MKKLLTRADKFQAAASNEAPRAECIADKATKIRGLYELTRSAGARLPALIADEDTETLLAERSAISLACARAQKLATRAEACRAVQFLRPHKRRGPPHPPPTARAPSPGRPGIVPRHEETRIQQKQLARL